MLQILISFVLLAVLGFSILLQSNKSADWFKESEIVANSVFLSIKKIENSFNLRVTTTQGVIPSVLAASDGGFQTHFQGDLKLNQKIPNGYTWIYGKHAVDSSRWSGFEYVCLSANTSTATTQGIYKGLLLVQSAFPSDQLFVSNNCGATSNNTLASFPGQISLTYYLQFYPGAFL